MKGIINKYFIAVLAIGMIASMSSCSSDDDDDDDTEVIVDNGNNDDNGGGNTPGGTVATSLSGEIATFDIAIDSLTAVTETEEVDALDEDFIENSSFSKTIKVNYNGTTATTEGTVDGVTVAVNGADVVVTAGDTKGVNYILSGKTTDGMFKVYGTKKYQITLNGVDITNNDGPAINDQSGKRVFTVLADGTTNKLTDGTSYASSTEDQKGAFFAEGKIIISGSGKLRVYGNKKAGISADDRVVIHKNANVYVKSTAGNGIKANDEIRINGGIVNVETSATAAKAISCDSIVNINGGRVICLTTGGGEYDEDDNDASACAGIKSDSTINITGGEVYCKSTGAGGKGLSCDNVINISGGKVRIVTTGKKYTYGSSDSSPKGIKADGNLTISGGDIMVRALGGEGSEGIESKGLMYITGGTLNIYTYDDALNSAKDMHIQGGTVFAYATNNDAIDSNGNLYFEGGTTIAYGASQPECGIDAAEGYNVYINGGTLVAIGGGTSYPATASKQPSIIYGGSISNGSTVTLSNGSTAVLSFTMQGNYGQSCVVLMTSPNLTKGGSYTLTSGSSSLGSVSSLASPYSTIGSVNGMGGGGMPGNNPGGGPGGRF